MSATLYDALNELHIHSTVPVDSDVGIRFGMANQGLLTKTISYKPTRDETISTGHRGSDAVMIMRNPKLVISVDADVTLLAGALAAKHPGEPIHKGYVLDFYPEIAHRFQTSSGYFIMQNPETTSGQGILNAGKFDLRWWCAQNNQSQHVASPAAPV